MKKTLKAIEAKEEELLETVEKPLHWMQHHWLIVTVVALLVIGGISGWRYHLFTQAVVKDTQWQEFAEILEDEDAQQDQAAMIEKIEIFLKKDDLPDGVKATALLELGLLFRDSKRLDEARTTFNEISSLPGDQFDLAKSVAQKQLEILDADARWDSENAPEAQAVERGGENPQVSFATTKGKVVVELFEDHAPNTTANLIELIEGNWYEGLSVHSVLPNAVRIGRRYNIPEGRRVTEEGPGYLIRAEIHPDLHHDEGMVGMWRGRDYDSAGAQIFFNLKDNRAVYDGKYAVIGKVTEGLEALKELEQDEDFILRDAIVQKRDHAYSVDKLPEE